MMTEEKIEKYIKKNTGRSQDQAVTEITAIFDCYGILDIAKYQEALETLYRLRHLDRALNELTNDTGKRHFVKEYIKEIKEDLASQRARP